MLQETFKLNYSMNKVVSLIKVLIVFFQIDIQKNTCVSVTWGAHAVDFVSQVDHAALYS